MLTLHFYVKLKVKPKVIFPKNNELNTTVSINISILQVTFNFGKLLILRKD